MKEVFRGYHKSTPHNDHILDFARVLLASFPSSCTIRPSKAWSPPVGEVSTQVDRGVDRQTSLASLVVDLKTLSLPSTTPHCTI